MEHRLSPQIFVSQVLCYCWARNARLRHFVTTGTPPTMPQLNITHDPLMYAFCVETFQAVALETGHVCFFLVINPARRVEFADCSATTNTGEHCE